MVVVIVGDVGRVAVVDVDGVVQYPSLTCNLTFILSNGNNRTVLTAPPDKPAIKGAIAFFDNNDDDGVDVDDGSDDDDLVSFSIVILFQILFRLSFLDG